MPNPSQALSKLLIRLFSAGELREFVRFGPGASGIYPWLPEGDASRAELALTLVDLLERRGAIDAELFERLRQERSARRNEIDEVAALFLRVHGDALQTSPIVKESAEPSRQKSDAPALQTSPIVKESAESARQQSDAPALQTSPIVEESAEPARQQSDAPALQTSPIVKESAEPAQQQSDAPAPKVTTAARLPESTPRRAAPWRWIALGASLIAIAVGAPFLPWCDPPQEHDVPAKEPVRPAPPGPQPVEPSPAPVEKTAPVDTPPNPAVTPPNPTQDSSGLVGESKIAPSEPALRPRSRIKIKQAIDRAAIIDLLKCVDDAGDMERSGQTVSVRLEIDETGEIKGAVASGTRYGGDFHPCVARAVQRVRLAPGPVQNATYSWALQ